MAEPAESYNGMFVFQAEDNFQFQLGGFIIGKPKNLGHEYGHGLQERLLGPYYLPFVGLSSAFGQIFFRDHRRMYDTMWSEKWADDLGGVSR